MRSEESQTFDTVQLCLQRKAAARAEDNHGNLSKRSLASTKKARCPPPTPASSTGSCKALSSICSMSYFLWATLGLGQVLGAAWARDTDFSICSEGVLLDTLLHSTWSVKNTNFGARQWESSGETWGKLLNPPVPTVTL